MRAAGQQPTGPTAMLVATGGGLTVDAAMIRL